MAASKVVPWLLTRDRLARTSFSPFSSFFSSAIVDVHRWRDLATAAGLVRWSGGGRYGVLAGTLTKSSAGSKKPQRSKAERQLRCSESLLIIPKNWLFTTKIPRRVCSLYST
jgi:hypothetical protein